MIDTAFAIILICLSVYFIITEFLHCKECFTNYLGVASKCFDCESQMKYPNKYKSHSSKCFSCEHDLEKKYGAEYGFFAQPNNRMLWYEQSLTPKELKRPDFQVSTRNFFCEQESKWAFGDSNDYFYEDKERDVKGKDEYNNE